MIALGLIIIPLLLGTFCLFIRKETQRQLRRQMLLTAALLHFAGTVWLFFPGTPGNLPPLLVVDKPGHLILTVTSVLFLLAAIYGRGYFQLESNLSRQGVSSFYVPCTLFFLAAMTLTAVTPHLALLWVGIEATTLASAPLIYYHHHREGLEAAWKYLLICSVGIALALLGIFLLAAASRGSGAELTVDSMVQQASLLNVHWLRIAFLLVLVGFGTKMGLAPLHNWLPDAHSEAPSPVSALLSGALLNCAFLGILRFYQICLAAGQGPFAQRLFIFFGLLSMAVAAIFITGQREYKRMLAYSSIEHMGILTLSFGVGAVPWGLLHLINHSFSKALLFLTAGQILSGYQSKRITEVRGLLRTLPLTGILFLAGGMAIMGSPPFSPFVSEFLILRDGWAHGSWVAMVLYLLFLGIIFVSMSRIILHMVHGEKQSLAIPNWRPSPILVFPCLILASGILLMGIYLPAPLLEFLASAAAQFRGGL
jgi:hydrogenase-4 component F